MRGTVSDWCAVLGAKSEHGRARQDEAGEADHSEGKDEAGGAGEGASDGAGKGAGTRRRARWTRRSSRARSSTA